MGEKRYVYNALVVKPDGRISLAKPRSTHKDIIKNRS
jgi:hypothetical protein